MKEKNKKSMEEIIEKSPEEILKEKTFKRRKMYVRIISMWLLALVLGVTYYNMKVKSKEPKTVFLRTDEAPKELKDKIYIFYPKDNVLENAEITIPKVQSENELLMATITEIVKKLETDNFIPEINLKDVNYYILDNKIYLDLPEKIFDNISNAKSELLIIYSFVNSLTNIGGIERVKILINNADMDRVKYANLARDYTYQKDI